MSYLIRNYTLCLFINLLCTLWYKGGGHNNTNTFQSFIMQVCHWLECLSHGGPLLRVTPLSLPLLPDYPFTNTGKRKNEKKKIKITIWCNVIQYGTTIYINGPWQLVVFNNDEETHSHCSYTILKYYSDYNWHNYCSRVLHQTYCVHADISLQRNGARYKARYMYSIQ